MDLAVAQNAAATKLYRNTFGPSGVRVRLSGPPTNPSLIGTSLRFASQQGTVLREVQSGSGYWSVNSPVHVLHGAGELTLRLPDGRTLKTPVSPGLKEIEVTASGEIRALKR